MQQYRGNMTYVIHVLLLLTLGFTVMAAWDPEYCKDTSIVPTCLKDINELQKMRLPTDNRTLSRDCTNMENANKCYHEYVDRCFNGSSQAELKSKMSGIRQTVEKLCNNETYRGRLEEHYDCFKAMSTELDTCGDRFYESASAGPADMCRARTSFILCTLEQATKKKECSLISKIQICRVANFYANIIIPSSSCFTWRICPSAGISLQPSVILLLIALLIGVTSVK